ncbi:hypothetical protein TcCL_Unassigned01798 [Trypanosoma cruzi]|nr:hypothetical protein TcCL_Unassigned01798 [Trypanosoma cruzi]
MESQAAGAGRTTSLSILNEESMGANLPQHSQMCFCCFPRVFPDKSYCPYRGNTCPRTLKYCNLLRHDAGVPNTCGCRQYSMVCGASFHAITRSAPFPQSELFFVHPLRMLLLVMGLRAQ